MRAIVNDYFNVLNVALSFNGVCWWLIDLKADAETYHCNDHMCKTFSLDPARKGHSVRDTCPIAGDYLKYVECENPEDAERIFRDYKKLLNQEITEYSNVFPYFDAYSGITRHFLSRAKALTYDDKGDIELLFGIVEDVSEQVEQRIMLEADRVRFKQLSERDQLTGLYNRRHFEKQFQRECVQAVREQTCLGLLIIDVDCFKQYNDNYGHTAGDNCLVRIADAFQHVLSEPTDTAFRYGGEEFVVLSANTSVEALNLLARRLCEAVRAMQITHRHSRSAPYVTVSIGAVAGHISSCDPLPPVHLDRADEHLYLAKNAGRDRFRLLDLDAEISMRVNRAS